MVKNMVDETKEEKKEEKSNIERLGFPFTQGDYEDLVILLHDVDYLKIILEKDQELMALNRRVFDLAKDNEKSHSDYNQLATSQNILITSQATLITNLQNKVLCGQDDKWIKLKSKIVKEIEFKAEHAKNNEGFISYAKALSDVLLAMNLIEKEETDTTQEKSKAFESN